MLASVIQIYCEFKFVVDHICYILWYCDVMYDKFVYYYYYEILK